MSLKLKDIIDIQPGFSFRGRIAPKKNGKYQVLQIKDIGDEGNIKMSDLTRTDSGDISSEYLVQKGDVLFTTRGANRRAAFVGEEIPNTIFTAHIFSLRNIKPEVDPAYLAWYLNQKPAQNYFDTNASGSYVQNIRINVLAALPVKIPSLETQRSIAEIDRLRRCEKELIQQIESKRNQIIEHILINAAEKKD